MVAGKCRRTTAEWENTLQFRAASMG